MEWKNVAGGGSGGSFKIDLNSPPSFNVEEYHTDNADIYRVDMSDYMDSQIGKAYKRGRNDAMNDYMKYFDGYSPRILPPIKKLIFNRPATIVYWMDGSKTVVKCDTCDVFDPYKGIALCCMKKAFGNTGSYNDIFREYIHEIHDDEIEAFAESVVSERLKDIVANALYKNIISNKEESEK